MRKLARYWHWGMYGLLSISGTSEGGNPLHQGPRWREGVPPENVALEEARRLVAGEPLMTPQVLEILNAQGVSLWKIGDTQPPTLKAGERITLKGVHFGEGPNIDYAKILFGKARALERDLNMYEGTVILLSRHFYEKNKTFDQWPEDIKNWTPTEIQLTVPVTAQSGLLTISIQRRIGRNTSLVDSQRPHTVWDPLSERITQEAFPHRSDTVSVLGEARHSWPLYVKIENPSWNSLNRLGEAIFWAYDYNIGMTHHMSNLDWYKILKGEATDPLTGAPADPQKLFGAIPSNVGWVPEVVKQVVDFDPYPMPSPLKSLWRLTPPLQKGKTYPTGYVGYTYGEGVNPITEQTEKHIGFNCASCHARAVEYEEAPGRKTTRVFPGIPNPEWSMKWAVLDDMQGIKNREWSQKEGWVELDKTQLLYSVPAGSGEHSLVRSKSETHSPYHDDERFSPIAIPIITRHTPLRRALSKTELITGFEGAYVHSEEPDGAIGAMHAHELQALTAYMTTLDDNDQVLRRVGLYRTLQRRGWLAEVKFVSEGEFVQKGEDAFPLLTSRIAQGQRSFEQSCVRCHAHNFGTYTDENMISLSEVGSYFSPTIYQLEMQSIRTAPIRNLYWTAARGLLHDGHVRSVEDLLSPARLDTGSELYRRLYTLNPQSFGIAKGTKAQERALRRYPYFVDVPWSKTHLYWDYQKMWREFGPRELGSRERVSLPIVPHPWPAESEGAVDDLILYLMTL